MPKKALLVILDGFGLRDDGEGNAIAAADAPTLRRLLHDVLAPHPSDAVRSRPSRPREPGRRPGESGVSRGGNTLANTYLETSGEAVGLPPGQMGNSEVGHMNIGAGRIIYQMLTRIDKSIRDGDFFTNATLTEAAQAAVNSGGRLHLMGLVSDGGVHSSQVHLHALVELARRHGLTGDRTVVHAFTDGRDTSPTGGARYLTELQKLLDEKGTGVVATVSGRYHAMDRDKRWDRTAKAYDAIARGKGEAPKGDSAVAHVTASYAAGVTDEFVVPAVLRPELHVAEGDSLIFFNFRPDRARQITRAFTEPDFDGFPVSDRPRIHYASMTRYDETFTWVPYAFREERPENPLGAVVAEAGLKQLRVAETEKYAHVTYFLNGGEETSFPGEDRVLVQSPKDVPTYDHKPEMSAEGITDAVVEALSAGEHALIVVNFANCDMVGHTGSIDATVRAVETVDRCLARILEAAADGWEVFVTADHGNAEEMVNPDGSPQTAHTTLPVPFAYVGSRPDAKLKPGILADVAPTILDALGLPKPKEMTGKSRFE